ncbi:MAG: hypothetical protein P1V18_01205 [Candidatus Gracilibacteria bacterium]|nr:hypothetical protein [Candidatus Gracilibacteria bacterium]
MKKIAACAFALLTLTACGRTAASFDQLAQCMTDGGAKMYGANTCPHCLSQKKAFKGSFDLIDYVECNENPTKCQEAGIEAYPTWEINGEQTTGRKSLSELAELSGCSLKGETLDESAEEKTE